MRMECLLISRVCLEMSGLLLLLLLLKVSFEVATASLRDQLALTFTLLPFGCSMQRSRLGLIVGDLRQLFYSRLKSLMYYIIDFIVYNVKCNLYNNMWLI